jgi:hypothetical protein
MMIKILIDEGSLIGSIHIHIQIRFRVKFKIIKVNKRF